MKIIRRKLSTARRDRGQSLVELAISLTVMLLLLSGAVTFGMALFSYVALRDAAQEGALYGSFNPNSDSTYQTPNTTGITQRVRAASTSPINLADTSVIPNSYITVTATNAAGYPGQKVACEGAPSGAP